MRTSAAMRVAARALTVCAVLAGLVAMHGLGSAMGTGCPGGTTAMHATSVEKDGAVVVAGQAGHGTMCTPAPPRGNQIVASTAVAVTPIASLPVAQPAPGISRPTGAVPRAGPDLLIDLCVSRP